MLAMDVDNNAYCLNARVVLAFFASMLAPTAQQNTPPARSAVRCSRTHRM